MDNEANTTGADPVSDWLTASEVAEMLGVSRRTVSRLADERRIAHYRPHRGFRFRRQDVEAYLAATRLEPVSA